MMRMKRFGALVFAGLLLAACTNTVKMHYEPIANFSAFSSQPGNITPLDGDYIATLYKITRVDNRSNDKNQNPKDFPINPRALFVLPDQHYTDSGGIPSNMLISASFPLPYFLKPTDTEVIPAGMLKDFESGQISMPLRFVIVSKFQSGKTLADYKNGYFNPVFYDSRKHSVSDQRASLILNNHDKIPYDPMLVGYGTDAFYNKYK